MITCTWKSKDKGICENIATEKWTGIPYVDPYCGPFYQYGSEADRPPPDISYRCDMHIAHVIMMFAPKYGGIEAEKLLKRMYTIEKV